MYAYWFSTSRKGSFVGTFLKCSWGTRNIPSKLLFLEVESQYAYVEDNIFSNFLERIVNQCMSPYADTLLSVILWEETNIIYLFLAPEHEKPNTRTREIHPNEPSQSCAYWSRYHIQYRANIQIKQDLDLPEHGR